MDGIVILLILVAIWLIVGPIYALLKAGEARSEAKEAREELERALSRIDALEIKLRTGDAPVVLPERRQPKAGPVASENPAPETILERIANEARKLDAEEKAAAPPPLPQPAARKTLVDYGEAVPSRQAPAPPPLPGPEEPKEPFSLEKFMGVKLFAWLGGVAMFFGVIFFVKYAFENNLISPATRITLGFVTGAALLTGGLVTHRLPRYKVLAQAFCATGVLILYGVSFAAHAIYHFPAFGTFQTFGLMACITVAAFLIAVRLNALVVAVLGMLGGFMTPILLSTGQDQVLGLFGYIALLDMGLLALSRHGRWRFLTPCAAAGTALIQIGWFGKFFTRGGYDHGTLTLIPMGILLGFIALFLAGSWVKRKRPSLQAAGSVIGLAAVAMLFAFVMLWHRPVGMRYFLLHGFLLLVHLGVIASVVARPSLGFAQIVAALAGFIHLGCWTSLYLRPDNLNGTLVTYLAFGALHAVVPVVLSHRMPAGRVPVDPLKYSPWFPPLALAMMMLPILLLEPVPLVLWGGVLVGNLLVMGLAIMTRQMVPVLISLAMTMGFAAMWLIEGPSTDEALMPFLSVVTGFSLLFSAASHWLFRRDGVEGTSNRQAAACLPVASTVMPYALLILPLTRIPVENPSAIFGVALLMTAILSALGIFGKQGKLLLVALLGTFAVEAVWFFHHFDPRQPRISLIWFIGFHLLFLLLPFVFRWKCTRLPETWIASALSGVAHFLLVYPLIKQSFTDVCMGFVPLAYSIPSVLGMYGVWRFFPGMDKNQQSRLAWFGGVSLLFVTLVFPIQFERQWITVSWAMEGALLLWLYRRVPHPGLMFTGFALLVISFVRLTLNPAVFTVYERSGTPILNWHLYAYGIVAAALFAGARWFTDPGNRLQPLKPLACLYTMGGILLFLLLNIEIADFFTEPGNRYVAFRFGGNFARDMTYSIGWGLFSLALLGVGFRCGSRHARYTAIVLLVLTLVKVFLHDLAAIQNIFRIGALIGVAIIAFVASFLYQRFFDKPGNGPPTLT